MPKKRSSKSFLFEGCNGELVTAKPPVTGVSPLESFAMVSARSTPDACDYYKCIASIDESSDCAFTIMLFRLDLSFLFFNSLTDSAKLSYLVGELSVTSISVELSSFSVSEIMESLSRLDSLVLSDKLFIFTYPSGRIKSDKSYS